MLVMLENLTPLPEVNMLVAEVLAGAQAILGERLIGMYLDGSLAAGGFDEASDIDFVVVVDRAAAEDDFVALRALHDRISTIDVPLAIQLEGFYVPASALRRGDPSRTRCPNLERGLGERLKWVDLDLGWTIHRHVLHEHGITVVGPDPRKLVEPVTPDELRQAVTMFADWLGGLRDNPGQMASRGYQSYIVLTLCRILYTVAHGDVVSKATAVEWARETVGARWARLIDNAWEGRRGPDGPPAPDAVRETLAFIRYVLGTQGGAGE
ncbi:MAG: DUF4111 domain-containing protein [Anaerolineae bacterium]|jgi:hypothetical protein|nr:DUF4111 domain-containing protein [Anaerolineae bacterium]